MESLIKVVEGSELSKLRFMSKAQLGPEPAQKWPPRYPRRHTPAVRQNASVSPCMDAARPSLCHAPSPPQAASLDVESTRASLCSLSHSPLSPPCSPFLAQHQNVVASSMAATELPYCHLLSLLQCSTTQDDRAIAFLEHLRASLALSQRHRRTEMPRRLAARPPCRRRSRPGHRGWSPAKLPPPTCVDRVGDAPAPPPLPPPASSRRESASSCGSSVPISDQGPTLRIQTSPGGLCTVRLI